MLAGGRDENSDMLSSVEILNKEGGQWQSAEDMPAATAFHCQVSIADSHLASKVIYISQVDKTIFGGRGNNKAFRLKTDTSPWSWETSSEEFLSRRMHGCLVRSWGSYYLYGGVSDSGQPVRNHEYAADDLSYASSYSSDALPDEVVS